ncbi:hypothetical protein DL96DRAFT_1598170 [Flagelloscypha sp. PMI_526]|nr:hypothetical protein DL96DRAFT_1598170 [Flagelloscypha sp. PMI_526]
MPAKRKRSDSVAMNYAASTSSMPVRFDSLSNFPTTSQPPVPPPKKARAKKEPSEKRLARYKSVCPQNIRDRVDRVLSQRFFMVDRRRQGEDLKEVFSVLGSTGNVYEVTISHLPKCTCPDALKGNHCKHILFVFFKVLHVPMISTHWYQKALLTSELETIFGNAPLAPNHVTNPQIQKMFAQATGKTATSQDASGSSQPSQNRKMPTEEDDCPSELVFCEISCGKPLHKECFGQWKQTQRSRGATVTCVWCRSNWPEASSPGSVSRDGASYSEGYLNLGAAAGLSPVRDSSTYYNGVRRGESYRYGYSSRRRYYYDDDDY